MSASERQQLHLLEYVVLSKGKSTAALSLAWFSNAAARSLFCNTVALCSRPQVLFSFSKEPTVRCCCVCVHVYMHKNCKNSFVPFLRLLMLRSL